MDRRQFLVGLFGTAAVVAAGPIPKVLETLPDRDFIKAIQSAMPRSDEVYGDGLGNYGFATIKWLSEPPYIVVTPPPGMRALREESDRINAEVMAKLLGKA